MRYSIYTLIWQGIEIEARYCANNHNVIAHLEIETIKPPREPLPITKLAFCRIFTLLVQLRVNMMAML